MHAWWSPAHSFPPFCSRHLSSSLPSSFILSSPFILSSSSFVCPHSTFLLDLLWFNRPSPVPPSLAGHTSHPRSSTCSNSLPALLVFNELYFSIVFSSSLQKEAQSTSTLVAHSVEKLSHFSSAEFVLIKLQYLTNLPKGGSSIVAGGLAVCFVLIACTRSRRFGEQLLLPQPWNSVQTKTTILRAVLLHCQKPKTTTTVPHSPSNKGNNWDPTRQM